MNLVQILEDRAGEAPDQIALVEGCGGQKRQLSYAELAARVREGAGEFRRRGVKQGDWVMMLHPVSIDLYVALLAAMRIGAIAMLVDPGSGMAGFRRAVKRHRPAAWSGHGKGALVKWFVPTLWTMPRVRISGKQRPQIDDSLVEVDDEAPALVTFTSGSTGVPKAAMRSHGFLLTQNRVLGRTIDLQPGEVDLVTLPVFALANMAHGVASVLAGPDPVALTAQIRNERVTRCAVSPAYLTEWIDAGVPLDELVKIYTGGGPVFPPLLDKLREMAPDAAIAAVYGSTEAEPIAHLGMGEISPEDFEQMRVGGGLLTGRPVSEIQLAIIPDQWNQSISPMTAAEFQVLCMSAGNPGEIVVSGDHVLSGYLDGIGDNETKFRVDGKVWHRTGDAGKLDEHGRLWLLGRCAAVVRDARGALYPFAIETQLSFFGFIRRSAVLAVKGRRVLAVEVDQTHKRTDFPTPDGIDEMRVLDSIPVDRRHRAKIDYPALRQQLKE